MWVSKKNPIFNGAARPLPVLRLTSRVVENDRAEEKANFGPSMLCFPILDTQITFFAYEHPFSPQNFPRA